MLNKYIGDAIQVLDAPKNWEEAIRISCRPLVESKKIEHSYVDNIIKSVYKNGPYIVILPNVALPHTREQGDVNEVCISVTKFTSNIEFPEGKNVDIMFSIASPDSDGHMELIGDLGELLMDDELLESLREAQSVETLKKVLQV